MLISVGGATASATDWAYLIKANRRARFIDSIVAYLQRYDFDGIDVDLEGSAINSDYGDFITELSVEMQSRGLLLTAALAKWNGYLIPDAALAAFDFINLMAYDATGSWAPNNPGQHSSMQFAQQNLDYWVNSRGVPAENCVLGVPFYGYDFDNGGRGVRYGNIVAANDSAAYKDNIGQIYYNGKPTIAQKTVLSIENYGGVMIWEITQDAVGEHALIDTITSTISDKNYLIGSGNRKPNVAINTPTNNVVFKDGDDVSVTASIFDVDGTITYSAILIDGDTAKTFTDGPYETLLQGLGVGDYEVQAYAVDDKGKHKLSSKIYFSIQYSKPQIEVVTPLESQVLEVGKASTFEASISDTLGTVTFVAFLLDGDTIVKYSDGGTKSFQYTPSTYGISKFSVVARNDIGGEIVSAAIPVYINTDRSPYSGTASPIPGTIEAEYYDKGGFLLSYYDFDLENKGKATLREDASDIEEYQSGKFNLAYLEVGEWYEYTVAVAATDDYTLYASIAAVAAGGRFEIYVDDVLWLSSPTVFSTNGWTNFEELNVGYGTLSEGEHRIRFKVTNREFNLDYLRFESGISGVESYSESDSFNLYPNPAQDRLFIQADKGVETYEIWSMNGVFIEQGFYTEEGIDLSSYSTGLYLIKTEHYTHTFIVK